MPVKSKFKKTLKYLLFVIGIYCISAFSTIFFELLANRSINNQIDYLDKIMSEGYDDQLQLRFPEGKIFSNAIFSLAVIEFCNEHECDSTYSEIVDRNIDRMLSQKAMDNFDAEINPKNGIFYNGWTNLVLKKYQNSRLFNLSHQKDFTNEHREILNQRIMKSQKDSLRILDSYLDLNWPADNIIGILSIDNDSIQQKWINVLFQTTQHPSALIHHAGADPSGIRGSSQSMITFGLSEINYSGIKAYHSKFQEIFVDEYLGIQMVKENADGSGNQDVDSGPVIFGYGASATVMNIKAQQNLNNKSAKRTWALMNTISAPINLFGQKYYLFQKEPMFDIFMLWASVGISSKKLDYCQMLADDQSYVNNDKSDIEKYNSDRAKRSELLERNFELLIGEIRANGFPDISITGNQIDSCKNRAITITMIHAAQGKPEVFFGMENARLFQKELSNGNLDREVLRRATIIAVRTNDFCENLKPMISKSCELWGLDFSIFDQSSFVACD